MQEYKNAEWAFGPPFPVPASATATVAGFLFAPLRNPGGATLDRSVSYPVKPAVPGRQNLRAPSRPAVRAPSGKVTLVINNDIRYYLSSAETVRASTAFASMINFASVSCGGDNHAYEVEITDYH